MTIRKIEETKNKIKSLVGSSSYSYPQSSTTDGEYLVGTK